METELRDQTDIFPKSPIPNLERTKNNIEEKSSN